MSEGMTAHPRIITVRRRERLFYVGMAVAILITVFAGFSRSYFLKAHFGTPDRRVGHLRRQWLKKVRQHEVGGPQTGDDQTHDA